MELLKKKKLLLIILLLCRYNPYRALVLSIFYLQTFWSVETYFEFCTCSISIAYLYTLFSHSSFIFPISLLPWVFQWGLFLSSLNPWGWSNHTSPHAFFDHLNLSTLCGWTFWVHCIACIIHGSCGLHSSPYLIGPSIFLSKLSSISEFFVVNDHVSYPYISTVQIIVLYNHVLVFLNIYLVVKTEVIEWGDLLAVFILFFISLVSKLFC